jgi:type IV secretory pathway VirB10-like protein
MSDEMQQQPITHTPAPAPGWRGVQPWISSSRYVAGALLLVGFFGGEIWWHTHQGTAAAADPPPAATQKVSTIDPDDLVVHPNVRVTVPPAPMRTSQAVPIPTAAPAQAAQGPMAAMPAAADPPPTSPPTASPAQLAAQKRAQEAQDALDAPLVAQTPGGAAGSAQAQVAQVAQVAQRADREGAEIAPPSGYFLAPHTLVDVTLYSSIDSTVPGGITGWVGRDVLDYYERIVLIPKNSKIVGHMATTSLQPGQNRIGVVWEAVILPNGYEIALDNEPGVDLTGTTGFGATIDNHTRKELLNVIAFSVLAAGAQLAQPQNVCNGYGGCAPSVGQSIGQALGTQLSTYAANQYQRSANTQPTAHVVEGAQVGVETTGYLALPPWNPAQ